MDLYCNPLSSFSHKTKMAFYEKDVSFTEKLVDLFSPEGRQQYRKFYPLGKVPCLQTPKGLIPESTAIIEWLDQYYQVPKLIPTHPDDARQVRLKDRLADLYVTSNVSLLFFSEFESGRAAGRRSYGHCAASNSGDVRLFRKGTGGQAGQGFVCSW